MEVEFYIVDLIGLVRCRQHLEDIQAFRSLLLQVKRWQSRKLLKAFFPYLPEETCPRINDTSDKGPKLTHLSRSILSNTRSKLPVPIPITTIRALTAEARLFLALCLLVLYLINLLMPFPCAIQARLLTVLQSARTADINPVLYQKAFFFSDSLIYPLFWQTQTPYDQFSQSKY